MFEIDGDDILFRGVKVGHLSGGWPTLQDEAQSWLKGTIDGFIEEGEHVKLVKEGYKNGEADERLRQKRSIDEAERRADKEGYERGLAEGRERGYAAAIVDIPHAADVLRINLLLASCNKVYSLLSRALRQRKAKECRDDTRTALLELSEAARSYNSDK